MFRPGQVFKVKVELSPELVGFGRATILQSERKHILFRLKNSRGDKQTVPKGTRIWFVSNMSDNRMNGLWHSVVTDVRLLAGQQAIECRVPVFEPFSDRPEQRRRHKRAALQVPVKMLGTQWEDLEDSVISRNISRSGIGISVLQECPQRFTPGEEVDFILQTVTVDIELQGRIINARYNWLSNRTDVGLELLNMTPKSVDSLDRILLWLGSRPRKEAPEEAQKSETGALAAWLKSEKGDRKLLRTASGASESEIGTESAADGDDSDAADFEEE